MRWEWGSQVEEDYIRLCDEIAYKHGVEIERHGDNVYLVENGEWIKLNDDFRPHRPWWRAYVALLKRYEGEV